MDDTAVHLRNGCFKGNYKHNLNHNIRCYWKDVTCRRRRVKESDSKPEPEFATHQKPMFVRDYNRPGVVWKINPNLFFASLQP